MALPLPSLPRARALTRSRPRPPSRSLPFTLTIALPLLLPLAVILYSERADAGELSYGGDSLDQARWLPFGLLDRVQIAPLRASVTDEIGTIDSGVTSS